MRPASLAFMYQRALQVKMLFCAYGGSEAGTLLQREELIGLRSPLTASGWRW